MRSRDVDLPTRQLELIVDEPGAVHRQSSRVAWLGKQPDRVRDYYDARGESEWHRLAAAFDAGIEWEVHRRALEEWLPPGVRVLDLGGGPGRWAIWLARRGHQVVLGDLSPSQLRIARREIQAADVALEEILELDARDLSHFEDGAFDAVLAMGPFYHLSDGADRDRAAAEARRVMRPGGRLFATLMGRYAWALEILLAGSSARLPEVSRVLDSGIYRGELEGPFTDAYLVRPEEVAPFFEAAGFVTRRLLASQGFLHQAREQIADLQQRDPDGWPGLMDLAYRSAADPSILGMGGQLLFIGDAPHA